MDIRIFLRLFSLEKHAKKYRFRGENLDVSFVYLAPPFAKCNTPGRLQVKEYSVVLDTE